MNYKLIDMKVFGNERGKLVSLENGKNCLFDEKCCFYEKEYIRDFSEHKLPELNKINSYWRGTSLKTSIINLSRAA